MHELSLAFNIVEIASEELIKAGGTKIIKITIEMGLLSGVVYEALEFAMSEAIRDSCLANTKINYKIVKGLAKCTECLAEFPIEYYYDACPKCKSSKQEIIAGKEFRIKSMIIE